MISAVTTSLGGHLTSSSSAAAGFAAAFLALWPFPAKVLKEAAETCHSFISVELSMGQMIEDVRLATSCKKPVTLCNRVGGMIPSPDQVLDAIRAAEKGE